MDEEHARLRYDGRFRSPRTGWLTRVLGVAASVIILIGAFAISIVLFALALAGLVIFGGYLWWKTRHLRREMRSWSRGGEVIEGEVLRSEDVPEARPREPGDVRK